jgi:hypothetical protein
MATQPDNNPDGSPPDFGDFGAPDPDDIMGVLGVGDSTEAAAAIANKEPVTPPATPAEPTPPAEPPATPPAATPPAPVEPSVAPATPSATPAPAPAATPAVDESALRLASLEAQNAALQQALDDLRASPQPATPTGQPTPAAPESGQPPAPSPVPAPYRLTLPEKVQQALTSENPQENIAAINAIVNDLATVIHASVVTQVRQETQASLAALLEQANSTVQVDERERARAAARQQYYDAFPDHKNPLVEPLVQAEATKMSGEFPGLKWDANYINALGTRVSNAIASLTGQPPVAPEPTPTPTPNAPPARPARMLPSGVPAAAPNGGDLNSPDEIADTLSVF